MSAGPRPRPESKPLIAAVRAGDTLYLATDADGNCKEAYVAAKDFTTALRGLRIYQAVRQLGFTPQTLFAISPHPNATPPETPAPELRFNDLRLWEEHLNRSQGPQASQACQVVRAAPISTQGNDLVYLVYDPEDPTRITLNSARTERVIHEGNLHALVERMRAEELVSPVISDARTCIKTMTTSGHDLGTDDASIWSPSWTASPMAFKSPTSTLAQQERASWRLDTPEGASQVFLAARRDEFLPPGALVYDLPEPWVGSASSKILYVACGRNIEINTDERTLAGRPCTTQAQLTKIFQWVSNANSVSSSAEQHAVITTNPEPASSTLQLIANAWLAEVAASRESVLVSFPSAPPAAPTVTAAPVEVLGDFAGVPATGATAIDTTEETRTTHPPLPCASCDSPVATTTRTLRLATATAPAPAAAPELQAARRGDSAPVAPRTLRGSERPETRQPGASVPPRGAATANIPPSTPLVEAIQAARERRTALHTHPLYEMPR